MNIKYRFDVEKTIEVILYIAKQCPDIYTTLKILYFADKEHLANYGRLICGDSYVAMKHGPVPSGAYDLVKHVRDDGFTLANIDINKTFTIQDYDIIPLREADVDYLSESDQEALDEAIKQYGQMSFQKLKKLSHDDAYNSADRNDYISLEAIIKTLPNSKLLLTYV